jgi:hypothetical protein
MLKDEDVQIEKGVTPLRHYAVTPLRHYAITPLRHYTFYLLLAFINFDNITEIIMHSFTRFSIVSFSM